ncbi:transposase [Streptomyces vinaceus]
MLICRPCPFREQCTASQQERRMLTLQPRESHEALVRARTERKTDTWKDKYALRAGIEGTINQALDITGIRRPATAACRKSASSTPSPPPRSTSSASTPTGPTTPSAGYAPAASNTSPTNSPHDQQLSNGVHGCLKTRTTTTKPPPGPTAPNPIPLDRKRHEMSQADGLPPDLQAP